MTRQALPAVKRVFQLLNALKARSKMGLAVNNLLLPFKVLQTSRQHRGIRADIAHRNFQGV